MVASMEVMFEELGFFTKLSMSAHRSGSHPVWRSSRLNTKPVACASSEASAWVTGSG